MTGPLRFGLLVLVGYLLAQAAWMLAVPPFRGADEFDHAYRAAGVASGQWRLTEPAVDGRGLQVEVPVELVNAAQDQCRSLPYTGPDNCRPIDVERDRATVATAAATYPPAYYWLVGTVGEPLTGSASLYAMRLASSLLCAVGLAVAAALLSRIGGVWTKLGFVASVTPVFAYSTVVAAPNGPEMVAGACLWAGLLALGAERGSPRLTLVSLGVVGLSTILLTNLRLLGPGWTVLILAVVSIYVGPRRLWRRSGEHKSVTAVVVGVSLVAALVAIAWTFTSDGLAPARLTDGGDRRQFVAADALSMLPLWQLQVVGAFPLPNQPGPVAIYPLVILVFAGLVLLAARRTGWTRQTGAIVLALGVGLTGPLALTLATMDSQGVIWQGRYALPFLVGILPMAGLVLDRSGARPRERWLVAVVLVMIALAHVLSVTRVLRDELQRPVSTADGSWVQPSTWCVVLLMLTGWLVLGVGVTGSRAQSRQGDRCQPLGSQGPRRDQSSPSENADSRSCLE